jgi:hypothetical protein
MLAAVAKRNGVLACSVSNVLNGSTERVTITSPRIDKNSLLVRFNALYVAGAQRRLEFNALHLSTPAPFSLQDFT